MKKSIFSLITLFFVINSAVYSQRGQLVYTYMGAMLSPEQIMTNLRLNMDESTFDLINLATFKSYSVQTINIAYSTIDNEGLPIVASGIVFVPVTDTIQLCPVMAYLHGTITNDSLAPSFLAGKETLIGWIMSMDGYISVLPDYVGIGLVDGPGLHPYYHAASEASATIDMIKAVGELSSQMYAKPDGRLYISGYSQGGHAALATQRELEKNPVPGIDLQITIAGSGAYSLSFIQKYFMLNNPAYPNPGYFPYILLGFQDTYKNLYSDLKEVFAEPYDSIIPELFDGAHNLADIDSMLPVGAWQTMLNPKYLRDIQYKYYHPFNQALLKNDLINWKPETKLNLYYCSCDELVAKENSLLAYFSFIIRGSKSVTCLPIGPFDHLTCAPYVLLLSKIQFDCASNINPCMSDALADLSITKSTSDKSMNQLALAAEGTETIDIKELYANKQLSKYLDVDEQFSKDLVITPNPVNDIAFIEIPGNISFNSRISVYDMLGKLVYEGSIDNTIVQIDAQKLKAGIYNVVIRGDEYYTGSFLKTE